jgi:hypothetical protein
VRPSPPGRIPTQSLLLTNPPHANGSTVRTYCAHHLLWGGLECPPLHREVIARASVVALSRSHVSSAKGFRPGLLCGFMMTFRKATWWREKRKQHPRPTAVRCPRDWRSRGSPFEEGPATDAQKLGECLVSRAFPGDSTDMETRKARWRDTAEAEMRDRHETVPRHDRTSTIQARSSSTVRIRR